MPRITPLQVKPGFAVMTEDARKKTRGQQEILRTSCGIIYSSSNSGDTDKNYEVVLSCK
jgi:hypothetical protein